MSSVALYLLAYLLISLTFRITRLVMVIRHSRRQGRGSMAAKPIFWVMTYSYLLFIAICGAEAFQTQRPFQWSVSLGGLSLYVLALSMRERAMQDLGRFFSPDIEIRKEHKVIRQGLYRYVRHPLLTCMGFEIIAVALVFNAYYSGLVLGLGFYFPLLWIRKTLEEKKLLQTLGSNYRLYCQDVGAFWPKLSRLRKVRYV